MKRLGSLLFIGLLLSLSGSVSAQETATTQRGKVTGSKISTHPDSPFRYLDVKTEALLKSGKDVDISE